MESIRREWAVTAFAIQFCGTILHKMLSNIKETFSFFISLIEFSIKVTLSSSPSRSPPLLVSPVLLVQVLPRPQLLFPSKTWFFGIHLNFQWQKSL
jgi:hypothetical protein